MISKPIRTAILATILAASLAAALPAQAQTPIGVSYQPSLYWALPFHYATVKGWWKEVGLTPTFSTFPAGAPQILGPTNSVIRGLRRRLRVSRLVRKVLITILL